MTFEEFAAAVSRARELIPDTFRRLLEQEGISILPRERMPESVRENYPRSIVFGLFVGVARKDASAFMVPLEPTRIELYQESFEKMYGPDLSPDVEEEIVRTVVHEIAHYFGLDEKAIRRYGY